jgi:hypothetical protein
MRARSQKGTKFFVEHGQPKKAKGERAARGEERGRQETAQDLEAAQNKQT